MDDDAAGCDIFTAAAAPGGGEGGWVALIVPWTPRYAELETRYRTLRGAEQTASTDRLELLAMLAALAAVPPGESVRLVTRNQRLHRGVTVELARWCANGWRTASDRPLAHAELWERLEAARRGRSVTCVREGDFAGFSLLGLAHKLATRTAHAAGTAQPLD